LTRKSHQGLHPGLLGPLPPVAAKKYIKYIVRFSGLRLIAVSLHSDIVRV